MEAARAVLAGRSFTEGEDDPFEGLGPQEIQAYIDKALEGISHTDPFEVQPGCSVLDTHFGLPLWCSFTYSSHAARLHDAGDQISNLHSTLRRLKLH